MTCFIVRPWTYFSQPNVSIRSSGSLVPAQLGERDQEIPDLLRRLLPAPLGLCIRLPAHGAGDHADYRAQVDDDADFFREFSWSFFTWSSYGILDVPTNGNQQYWRILPSVGDIR